MKVMAGGTFDHLHAGHKALLAAAFNLAGSGGSVLIGLTLDTFASHKSHKVLPYETRMRELEAWIAQEYFDAAYTIEPLNDPFGSALEIDFDILVVSYDTFANGELINKKRIERGLKPVMLHRISCVLARDGKPVSSTRINSGEINPAGETLSPILK